MVRWEFRFWGSSPTTRVMLSLAETTLGDIGVTPGAAVGAGVDPAEVAGATGAEVGVAVLVAAWSGTGVSGAAPAQATANTITATTTAILQGLRLRVPTATPLLANL